MPLEIAEQDRPAERGTLSGKDAWVLLVLLLLVFDVVKVGFVEYSVSDENIYFCMGKLVSDGHLPYRDFRFAHPPLKLLPPAAVFAVAGFDFTVLKLLPVLATNLTALFVFLFLRRAAGNLHAVVGSAAFLFSFAGLYYTSYYMGTNLTVMFLVIGLTLTERRRDRFAGVLYGLALTTGIYAGPAITVIGIYLFVKERRRLLGTVIGALLVFLPVNFAGLALGGTGYLKQVYWFHLLKSPDPTLPKGETVRRILHLNPALLSAAALYPLFRRRETDLWFLSGLAAAALIALYPSVHDYYFLLAAPFLAVAGTMTLLALVRWIRLSPGGSVAVTFLALAVFSGAHALTAKKAIARSAVPSAPEMARLVTEREGEAVFGVAELAPLVALLSERPVLEAQVDTNGKVYVTGLAAGELAAVTEILSSERRVILITKEKLVDERTSVFYGPMVDADFRRFVQEQCPVFHYYVNARDPTEHLQLREKSR